MKYDVFISYSRKDTEIANKIGKAFEDNGITFFIDRQGIGGGLEFPAVLAKAIRESKVFLFLASKNSYDSKFTQSEIIYAFNKKDKSNILPYIIDESTLPDELEFTFSAINWRRMSEHPIETTLVDDILSKTGKSRPKQQSSQANLNTEQEKLPKSMNAKMKYMRYLGVIIVCAFLSIILITFLFNKNGTDNTKDNIQPANTSTITKNENVENILIINSVIGSYDYTGELNYDGEPNGNGKAVFVNGDIYDGVFSNGNIIRGRYTWAEDGTYFEGEFENNEPNEKKGFYYDKDGNKQQK